MPQHRACLQNRIKDEQKCKRLREKKKEHQQRAKKSVGSPKRILPFSKTRVCPWKDGCRIGPLSVLLYPFHNMVSTAERREQWWVWPHVLLRILQMWKQRGRNDVRQRSAFNQGLKAFGCGHICFTVQTSDSKVGYFTHMTRGTCSIT